MIITLFLYKDAILSQNQE